MWTRLSQGGNGRYSWILGTWYHYHANEGILVQSRSSLSFW
jgi:hypothetical protein